MVVRHTIGIAVLILAVAVVGSAAAYNDDFGNTFGSKQECLDWWGSYPEACSAPDDGGSFTLSNEMGSTSFSRSSLLGGR